MSKVEVVYDTDFFQRQSTGSRRSALVVLEIVFGWLAPRRIVDVGCGVGTWLAAALELGAGAIFGIDGAHVDRAALQIPMESFAELDIENEAIDKAVTAGDGFDLVICMEVAEHLSFHRAPSFVRELASLGDTVLFSAAVPYQAGTNHINEQWPEFWAILFEAEGYVCLDVIRDRIWYNGDVEWWYRQNALLFVRRGSESHDRIVAATAGEVARPALSRVHAENLLFQVLNTFRPHRAAAREEEVADLRAVLSAYAEVATVLPPFAAVARADLRPEADDVFPRTRMIVSEPERDEAWLRNRVQAAEAAHAAAADLLAATQALAQARGTELAVTRDLLDERQNQLEVTRGLLTERQSQLDDTRQLLYERQAWIDAAQALAQARGTELAVTRDLLDERQSQLEVTRGLLTERQSQLDDTRQLLYERQAWIDAAQALAQARGTELAVTRDLLDERQSQLEVTRGLLTERQSQLDDTRQLLYERQALIDAALAERDEAIRQFESASATLNERSAVLEDVNRRLEERSDELDAARRALADQTGHADDLAEVLLRQEAVLKTLQARTEQGGRDLDVAYREVAALRHDLRRIPRLVRRLFGMHSGA